MDIGLIYGYELDIVIQDGYKVIEIYKLDVEIYVVYKPNPISKSYIKIQGPNPMSKSYIQNFFPIFYIYI